MYKIEVDGVLYAETGDLNTKDIAFGCFVDSNTGQVYTRGQSKWYGDEKQGVQTAAMFYDKGKTFKCHKHKERIRTFNRTQECLFCYKGGAIVELFDNNSKYIESVFLGEGDFIICYNGFHFLKIVKDDTRLLEVKNGPYTSVEEDKEYYDQV